MCDGKNVMATLCFSLPLIAAMVCQTNGVSGTTTVYLDTTGAPRYQTISCICTLEVTFTGIKTTVKVMPSGRNPEYIRLEVNGVPIDMNQNVVSAFTYYSPMVLQYVTSTDGLIRPQCFEFGGSINIYNITLRCMAPSAWTSTTTRPAMDTEKTTRIRKTKEATYLTTESFSDTTRGSKDNVGMKQQENNTSSNLVAVYAVAPIVGVLIVGAVVGGLLFWRLRQKSHGRCTERSNYVNTENLDETIVPNAERGHPYENEFNRHFSSNEHNYEGLDPQRERATNEHMYSGIGPERDLTNTTNNGSLTEDEQESTRHVYGNDYMSLETQREREHATKEHPYSGLQSRCDFANISYENTDGAYEHRDGQDREKHF